MKILVLTSRYTATRDIISEDFGRQVRLFSALAKLGNQVDFLVADYRKFENKDIRLHKINVAVRPFSVFSLLSFLRGLNEKLKNRKYDILIGSSDPLWGIFGYFLAKKNRVKFLYDLHDNYETYATYKMPFFKYFDRYVVKNSDVVTIISFALKSKISKIRKDKVFVIQNGVDTNLFKPMDKLKCRAELKLPKGAKIIAYTGSIQQRQGVDLLVNVFNKLKREVSNLKLVIAGRFVKGQEDKINLNQEGIIHLTLNQEKVAKLINAADVTIVPNRDDEFTRYCFPYKVVEYMACNTPIVATKLGDVELMLKGYKDSLCMPDNEEDMYKKIKIQLKKGKINYRKNIKNNTWDSIARKLDMILRERLILIIF